MCGSPRSRGGVWSRDGDRIFVTEESGAGPRHRFAAFAAEGQRLLERRIRSAEVASEGVAVSPGGGRMAFVRAPRNALQVNTGDLAVGRLGTGRADTLLTRAANTSRGSSIT